MLRWTWNFSNSSRPLCSLLDLYFCFLIFFNLLNFILQSFQPLHLMFKTSPKPWGMGTMALQVFSIFNFYDAHTIVPLYYTHFISWLSSFIHIGFLKLLILLIQAMHSMSFGHTLICYSLFHFSLHAVSPLLYHLIALKLLHCKIWLYRPDFKIRWSQWEMFPLISVGFGSSFKWV